METIIYETSSVSKIFVKNMIWNYPHDPTKILQNDGSSCVSHIGCNATGCWRCLFSGNV